MSIESERPQEQLTEKLLRTRCDEFFDNAENVRQTTADLAARGQEGVLGDIQMHMAAPEGAHYDLYVMNALDDLMANRMHDPGDGNAVVTGFVPFSAEHPLPVADISVSIDSKGEQTLAVATRKSGGWYSSLTIFRYDQMKDAFIFRPAIEDSAAVAEP